MIIIIKRFILSILILLAIAIVIRTTCTENTYVITYDTYILDTNNKQHFIHKQNEHILINACTKKSAIDNATDSLYLNILSLSDSIDIKNVEIL